MKKYGASVIRNRPGMEFWWRTALLALLLGYLLAFSIINFRGLNRFIDPDSYADTVVARYMWEQKTLFPEGWVFGNQYYVVATPVLAALFYGLTGSMNLSMALATTTMTLLLLIALTWLLRSFLDWTQTLAGLTTLVAATLVAMDLRFKPEGQLLFVIASYYSCYLLTLLVVWGDYIQGLFKGKQTFCPAFFLGLVLSLATGMQSIRQTCIMVMPLLAFECLRVLLMLLGRISRNWMPTLRAGCVTAANLAGLVLIRSLHVPALHIYGTGSLIRPEQFFSQLRDILQAALQAVGIGYLQLDPPWFIISFSMICCAAVAMALWHAVGRVIQGKAGALDALLALCVLSLLAVAASGLLLSITIRSPYFFIWYLLVCLSVVSLLGTNRAWRRQTVLFLLCIAATANLWYSYKHNVDLSLQNEDNAWTEVAGELMDGDYEILYGKYWDAGIICSHTDGKVLCSPWFFAPFQPLTYICPQDLRGPEDHLRAAYLVLDGEQADLWRRAEETGAELTLVREFSGMSLYTASEQLMQ